MNPLLYTDSYKLLHRTIAPPNTSLLYSNFTPRGSRDGFNNVIFFGLQYLLKEYLIDQFRYNFFNQSKSKVLKEYKEYILPFAGNADVDHIAQLYDLNYLPIEIKALPEGSFVPSRIPVLTVRNTHPDFFWLTNYLETLISNVLWHPCTTATTAFRFRKTFEEYAKLTCENNDLCKFQAHDFSCRGLSSVESSRVNGAAFLLSSCGTDNICSIDFLQKYYFADQSKELIGCSVPATEHCYSTIEGVEGEINCIRRMIQTYPTGIISCVLDSYDYFKVLIEYLPILKSEIMARDGKFVCRPDSSPKTPLEIICGDNESDNEAERKGTLQILWELFGGKVNSKGYRELDSHISCLYGEAITLDLQKKILETMKDQGFASNNVVFGVGSYSIQFATRDSYGWSFKMTYAEVDGKPRNVFKAPKTDPGIKKSACGLLQVKKVNGKYTVKDQCTWEEEKDSELKTVFKDGQLIRETNLKEIRERIESYL